MYSPFRHISSILIKKRPIHLTFFLTRRCNAKCPFCFYLRSDGDLTNHVQELSLDEIRRISTSLGELLWLAFSGGEIFLRDDLPEISRLFYRQNKPALMLLPTNGLLPDRIRDMTGQILKDCPKSTVVVKLSLDGIGEHNDRIRNTPGSFLKTLQTYQLLRGLPDAHPNFELGINTVFCSENQDSMDELIDFVSTLHGVKTHTISLIRGNLSDKTFKAVDLKKYQHAVSRLEQNLKKKESAKTYRFQGARIKAAQDILQRNLICRTNAEQKRLIPCYAGTLNIVLEEAGEVFPCESLKRGLGNVRDHGYDMQKLLKSDRAKAILNSIRDRQCYCTHECYFMTNILFNPLMYPALAREYLQIGQP